jgi:hypothetical protein
MNISVSPEILQPVQVNRGWRPPSYVEQQTFTAKAFMFYQDWSKAFMFYQDRSKFQGNREKREIKPKPPVIQTEIKGSGAVTVES